MSMTVERKQALVAARDYLRKLTNNELPEVLANTPDTVVEALQVLYPPRAAKSKRAGQPSLIERLCAMFPEVGTEVSLFEIFKTFKMGVAEMRVRIRECIYNPEPADRHWITYNPDTEMYRLVGIGATPPEGWTGVLPKELRGE